MVVGVDAEADAFLPTNLVRKSAARRAGAGTSQMVPSVKTPSTSKKTILMRRARWMIRLGRCQCHDSILPAADGGRSTLAGAFRKNECMGPEPGAARPEGLAPEAITERDG